MVTRTKPKGAEQLQTKGTFFAQLDNAIFIAPSVSWSIELPGMAVACCNNRLLAEMNGRSMDMNWSQFVSSGQVPLFHSIVAVFDVNIIRFAREQESAIFGLTSCWNQTPGGQLECLSSYCDSLNHSFHTTVPPPYPPPSSLPLCKWSELQKDDRIDNNAGDRLKEGTSTERYWGKWKERVCHRITNWTNYYCWYFTTSDEEIVRWQMGYWSTRSNSDTHDCCESQTNCTSFWHNH